MPQQISRGDALAIKKFSVAVFAESFRRATFSRTMTGTAPKLPKTLNKAKMRQQTHADMPIIAINDLAKSHGDQVQVDLFHSLKGKPIMGDEKIQGRGMVYNWSKMNVYIDQYRAMVDPGGRMTQQRTLHDLRAVTLANLAEWGGRLEDQLCYVHLAGARGSQNDPEWTVPLESDTGQDGGATFTEVMVNEVLPPTRNRHFFADNATKISEIDTTEHFSLETLSMLRVRLQEMALPPSPIRIPGDYMAEGQPLYCVYVTPRQWHYLKITIGEGSWRQFLADATPRYRDTRHPLFLGNVGVWEGFAIKMSPRAIRFNPGDQVAITTDANGTKNAAHADGIVPNFGGAAGAAVDRALVLGGQALASAFGMHGKSGYMAEWHEELTDHENTREVSLAWMGGKKKIRFRLADGNVEDFGVMVIDSYAPDPFKAAGQTLAASLRKLPARAAAGG